LKAYEKESIVYIKLHIHLVCIGEYRYAVLKGDIQLRFRDLIPQMYDTKDLKNTQNSRWLNCPLIYVMEIEPTVFLK